MASRLLLFGGIRTPKDNLLAGLAADGILPLLDRLWLFAQPTAALALVDLIAGATATAVNSPTFTANKGYAGNGSTSYINTGYVPTTNAVTFSQNKAHLALYDRSANAMSGVVILCGAQEGISTKSLTVFTNGGSWASGVNTNATPNENTTPANRQGMTIVTRTADGNGGFKRYSNGVDTGATTTAGSTVTPPAFAIYIGGLNRAGSLVAPTIDEISMFSVGAGLNATQAAALSSRINAYMTAIGSNVY